MPVQRPRQARLRRGLGQRTAPWKNANILILAVENFVAPALSPRPRHTMYDHTSARRSCYAAATRDASTASACASSPSTSAGAPAHAGRGSGRHQYALPPAQGPRRALVKAYRHSCQSCPSPPKSWGDTAAPRRGRSHARGGQHTFGALSAPPPSPRGPVSRTLRDRHRPRKLQARWAGPQTQPAPRS